MGENKVDCTRIYSTRTQSVCVCIIKCEYIFTNVYQRHTRALHCVHLSLFHCSFLFCVRFDEIKTIERKSWRLM